MDGLSQQGLKDFCFTDIDVTSLKKERWQGKINFETCSVIPFPESLEKCDNIDILFAWNLWYHLILLVRRKMRTVKSKMKRKDRKDWIRPNINEPIAVFSYSDVEKTIKLTVQPWAAEILAIEPTMTFPYPPYCPLDVYTEMLSKINGSK